MGTMQESSIARKVMAESAQKGKEWQKKQKMDAMKREEIINFIMSFLNKTVDSMTEAEKRKFVELGNDPETKKILDDMWSMNFMYRAIEENLKKQDEKDR